MQAAHIIPESFPDVVSDVAEGATFYVNPDRHPKHEGHAWIRVKRAGDLEESQERSWSSAPLFPAVRLRDGFFAFWPAHEPVRVVALAAEVVDEKW